MAKRVCRILMVLITSIAALVVAGYFLINNALGFASFHSHYPFDDGAGYFTKEFAKNYNAYMADHYYILGLATVAGVILGWAIGKKCIPNVKNALAGR